MGSAETKKLKKKDGKYKYECPNYCKNVKYRNDTKYSTRNLVCKKCGKRLIRWQPAISKERGIFNTVLNDSDTPSIPLYDTDNPDKPVEIGKLDDSSESQVKQNRHQVILTKRPGRKQMTLRDNTTLAPRKKRMLTLLNCN